MELKELQQQKKNTPVGTVSFPALFAPKEFNGKSKYECTILLDKKEDISAIKKLVSDMISAKWGKKPAKFTSPFKDGNEKDLDKYPMYEDKICITASTQFQPQVIDGSLEEILNADEVYAGCTGRMAVSAYCWDYMGKSGVSFNLVAFQKIGDGERVGGRASAKDLFDAVETEADVASDDMDFDL